MSILNRLLGREMNSDKGCCDMQIKEIDADELERDRSNQRTDRAED